MCNYTQTLHTLCGCKTLDLTTPNPCRVAVRNSMPCVYRAPRPDSIGSMPSLTFSSSSISSMAFSPQSPRMSFNSFSGSPQYRSFIASLEKKQEEDDGLRRSMSLCPFHMEDRLEFLEEHSKREKRGGFSRHAGTKARQQRRGRQQEEWRLAEERKERKRLAKQREEKKRKWMPSPKKFGRWTNKMVRMAVADGTGELKEWDGYVYLVTEHGPQFLGWL